MENANSFGVHFLLRLNKQPKAGKYSVYAKISVNNSVTEMATKTYLFPKDWNAVKGFAKPKDADLIQFNNHLVAIHSKMAAKFQEMELDEAMLTAQELKRKYLGLDKPERKLTLKWLFEEHTRKMKVTLKPGTLKNYYTTRDYIKKYLAEECGGDILLRHLQYEFIEDFQVFVLNNPAKQHDPCTNNGVMKHLERLKKVVKWAAKNRWIVNNPFQYFSLKQDPTTIEFLSKEQLDNLERLLFHSRK